jgi:cytochrome c-type biogenesis protein CcmF
MAAFAIALIAVAASFAAAGGATSLWAPFGIGLALFVMAGSVIDLSERIGLFRVPLRIVRTRAAGLPRSAWGTSVAHFGLAMTLLGIVCVSTWAGERIVALTPGQTVTLAGYELAFDGLVQRTGTNYREHAAKFTVREGGAQIGTMEPAKRTFASRGTTTTEAALMTRGFSQLYLSLGDVQADGAVAIRLYYKPMVLLIWLGAVVMMLGGALSLSDRRLRVGAPKPARKPAKPTLQPAE